jgi:hypothetical protein
MGTRTALLCALLSLGIADCYEDNDHAPDGDGDVDADTSADADADTDADDDGDSDTGPCPGDFEFVGPTGAGTGFCWTEPPDAHGDVHRARAVTCAPDEDFPVCKGR